MILKWNKKNSWLICFDFNFDSPLEIKFDKISSDHLLYLLLYLANSVFQKWNFSTLLHIPVLNVLLRVYENFLLTFALFICNSLPVIRSYYTWVQKKISGLWQDIIESFMNIIKGILLLFNLENSWNIPWLIWFGEFNEVPV